MQPETAAPLLLVAASARALAQSARQRASRLWMQLDAVGGPA